MTPLLKFICRNDGQGTLYNAPCDDPMCGMERCENMRMAVTLLCIYCMKPIGYNRCYEVGSRPGDIWHLNCKAK